MKIIFKKCAFRIIQRLSQMSQVFTGTYARSSLDILRLDNTTYHISIGHAASILGASRRAFDDVPNHGKSEIPTFIRDLLFVDLRLVLVRLRESIHTGRKTSNYS